MTDETIELRFFRLVTGEDVISQTYINRLDSGNVYILVQPLKIGYLVQNSGRIGISLYNWIFPNITEEQKFPVFPSDILTTSKPSKRMIKYYWDTISRHGKSDDEEDTSIKDDYDYDETDMDDEDEMTEEDQKDIMDELEKIKRKYH